MRKVHPEGGEGTKKAKGRKSVKETSCAKKKAFGFEESGAAGEKEV